MTDTSGHNFPNVWISKLMMLSMYESDVGLPAFNGGQTHRGRSSVLNGMTCGPHFSKPFLRNRRLTTVECDTAHLLGLVASQDLQLVGLLVKLKPLLGEYATHATDDFSRFDRIILCERKS